MIAKFNNIFYLIIFLAHFIGIAAYCFQTIVGTKKFMDKFGIDHSAAVMVRFVGALMLGWVIMAIYIMFVRPCLLYTSPSPRDDELSRMPSSA